MEDIILAVILLGWGAICCVALLAVWRVCVAPLFHKEEEQ